MLRRTSFRLACLAISASALVASPLYADAASIIKSRIAGYREVGTAFKNINDELRSRSPQVMLIQISAREIVMATQEQNQWFPKGSHYSPRAKTRAKSAIWSKPVAFKAAQEDFVKQASAFNRIARGGNVKQMQGAARTLGRTCVSCHRQFREED